MNMNKVVESQKMTIQKIASKEWRKKPNIAAKFEFQDLIGYGYVGLMEALRKFKKDKGFQFDTFAQYRIRGAMLDGLRNRKKNQEFDFVPLSEINIDDIVMERPIQKEPIYQNEIKKQLKEIMNESLSKIEFSILYSLYFLNKTQKEISKENMISESRISQIHKKAILKLRNFLKTKGIIKLNQF